MGFLLGVDHSAMKSTVRPIFGSCTQYRFISNSGKFSVLDVPLNFRIFEHSCSLATRDPCKIYDTPSLKTSK